MLGVDPKAARSAWTYAIVAAAIYILIVIRKTLLMFIIAVMFAYLLYPLVEWVEKRFRFKTRTSAVILPFALIFIMAACFGLIIKRQVRTEVNQFHEARTGFKDRLATWKVWGFPAGRMIIDNTNAKKAFEMMPQLKNTLKVILREVEHVFIIPILSFLILLDGPRIRDSLVGMLSSTEHGIAISTRGRAAVESVLRDAHTLILQYMQSLLLLCLATLVSFLTALKWMGVPYATLLALFAALWEFVPLVGPAISAAAILLATSLNTSHPSPHLHLLWVIAFLLGYRLFLDYVLSPQLMKKGVKLHPLLVMFGVFAGGEIGSVGGIFLSVPLLAVLRLVYYELCKYHFGQEKEVHTAVAVVTVEDTTQPLRCSVATTEPPVAASAT